MDIKKHTCPNCGSDSFAAHQVCYLSVIVDGENNFIDNENGDAGDAIYESENPYGPYTCIQCGMEFDELSDLDKPFMPKEQYAKLTIAFAGENHPELIRVLNWTSMVPDIVRDSVNRCKREAKMMKHDYAWLKDAILQDMLDESGIKAIFVNFATEKIKEIKL